MKSNCKSFKELSSQGHWDDIFNCLNIDVNSTIELASLKIPEHPNYLWLDDHKATLNFLETILGFIVLCDEIIYYVWLGYIILFSIKLHPNIFYAFKVLYSTMKHAFKKCRRQTPTKAIQL